MKSLLAIITRMYALRGADDDEFVAAWGGAEDQEFMIVPAYTNTWQRLMLIIHGYDYPRVANEDSILRAGKSVSHGLESNALVVPDCEVGLLFHPPLTWGATAKDHFAETVLNSTGRVNFVREYRSASRLVKEVAPMVRAYAENPAVAEDFPAEFDKVWNEYRSNLTRYDVRMGSLLTQVERPLIPLINKVDQWRQHGFEGNGASEFEDFQRAAREAFEHTINAKIILNAIGRIVNSLILETRSSDKLESIEQGFEDLEMFLGNKENRYVDMNETVELVSAIGDPPDAETLRRLGLKINEANPFRAWYLELVEKMERLRKVLALPDR